MRRLLYGLGCLSILSVVIGAQEPTPPDESDVGPRVLTLLRKAASEYQAGRLQEAVRSSAEAVAVSRQAFPKDRHPHGHFLLSRSLKQHSAILGAAGMIGPAAAALDEAVAMLRHEFSTTHPNGHEELAQSLNDLAYLREQAGEFSRALTLYEESLAMRKRLFPPSKYADGHEAIALSLNNIGMLLWKMGASTRALTYSQSALAMQRKIYPVDRFPKGHPNIAISLNNIGLQCLEAGDFEQSRRFAEEALAMKRRLFPPGTNPSGDAILAMSLNNVGLRCLEMGETDRALAILDEALTLKQSLYPPSRFPRGHPSLVTALNNVGQVLCHAREFNRSREYFQKSLAMCESLYPPNIFPNGHPDLALAHNNVGLVAFSSGDMENAQTHYQHALAITEKLYPPSRYPTGHPQLFATINNLTTILMCQGDHAKASDLITTTIRQIRSHFPVERYPNGHELLIRALTNLSSVRQMMGDLDGARSASAETWRWQLQQARLAVREAAESEALTFLKSLHLLRDMYLHLLREPGHADTAYQVVWQAKAGFTQLMERRHAVARNASGELKEHYASLQDLRRQIDRAMQSPRLVEAERDRELTRLLDAQRQIERKILQALPARTAAAPEGTNPADLAARLPDDTVLIDLVKSARVEQVKTPRDVRLFGIPTYSAFIVAPKRGPVRVDLGDALPIEKALQQWRDDIQQGRLSSAGTELARRVWAPIAPRLPEGTRVVYVAPDGELARLPWAALPVSDDRVLLETVALAVVPHGPFLLEQLRTPRPANEPANLLAVGDVDYRGTKWPPLPGTRVELEALTAMVPGDHATLTGSQVTIAELTKRLPAARYVHLAMHGEFRAQDLDKQRDRARDLFAVWREGGLSDQRRVAVQNPLGFSGLVLARGEVMSGLSLVDLPLENVRLTTLSACETGLGDAAAEDGAFGFQRAFHLAGVPNVVASLWQVSDAATAALMAKFYHEMWVNKKPPIEALREAQLTIYRHPELIPDLAGERGVPKLKAAVAAKMSVEPAGRRATAETKLWAAFVLSGVGK